MTLPTIRRALGIAGTVLLGGALALAPIAAFGGDMRIVSGTGIAGIVSLIVMRLLPRPAEPDDDARPATGDDVPPPP